MELTADELQLATRIYLFVGLTIAVLVFMKLTGRLQPWLAKISHQAFWVTAIGWEIWFTYGIIAGESVNQRRSEALNTVVPQHINWILNSLADVGMCLIGIYLVRLAYGSSNNAFKQWRWGGFAILLSWFMLQNIYVEVVIYAKQLSAGVISWAPMAPAGTWFNPVLFEIGSHPATLQAQTPWLLMTPLFYWMLIRIYKQHN